jgi:cytidylate kinase
LEAFMSATPHPVIAIDGTAASGKSTFARSLAQRLGFVYVNTGLMYRGVTWALQERGVALADEEAVSRSLPLLKIETWLEGSEVEFSVAGTDPAPHVRDSRVNDGVSLVAQVGAVRRLLVAQQQALALKSPLVMEGRDIGTVVFPGTPYKFFLDADPEVRADRRSRQGETDVIRKRDVLDSGRTNSPLVCAPEALRLDSGRATVEELVAAARKHLIEKGLPVPPAAGNA